MELKVLTQSITEPVTHDEVKNFMGYPLADTTQDDLIDTMITVAREFIEQKTGVSIVPKSYQVQFDREDGIDGGSGQSWDGGQRSNNWFELPIGPVLAAPAITSSMMGVSTTFQQRGLNKVSIYPDAIFSTVLVGQTFTPFYLDVIFQAGATNKTANLCLLSIVSQMFNYREGGISVNVSKLPYDTIRMLHSISVNL